MQTHSKCTLHGQTVTVEKGAGECCDPNRQDCPVTSSALATRRRRQGPLGHQPAQGPSTSCRQALPAGAKGSLGHPSGPSPALCLQFCGQGGEGLPKAPTPPTGHQWGGANVGRAGAPGAMSPPCPLPWQLLLSQKLSSRREHLRTIPQALRRFLDHVCVTSKPFRIPGTPVSLLPVCRGLTGSSGVQMPLGNSASNLHGEHTEHAQHDSER